jgi:PAS domain S-box-containing protein
MLDNLRGLFSIYRADEDFGVIRPNSAPQHSVDEALSGVSSRQWRYAHWSLALALVAALYFIAARWGLTLALANSSVSPVWPPTGLAIAAVILLGPRIAPGIFAGAVLTNFVNGSSLVVSLLLGIGNTGEALLGGILVRKFADDRRAFASREGALVYFLGAGLAAPLVSATLGIGTLVGAGSLAFAEAGLLWLTWYLGDAVGALVVGPAILLLARPMSEWRFPRRIAESTTVVAVLMALALLVFGLLPMPRADLTPLAVLFAPPILWAAFRLGPTVAALMVLALDGVAILATQANLGPFASQDSYEGLLLLQVFMATLSVTALSVAIIVSERRAETATLEERVNERTARLQLEIRERSEMQRQLMDAQALAKVGSWQWDIRRDVVDASPELARIFGMAPGDTPRQMNGYLAALHPDDRPKLEQIVESAIANRQSSEARFRIIRPDGQTRYLHAEAKIQLDRDGEPLRFSGIVRDVTERDAQERKFHALLEAAPDAMVIADAKGKIVFVNAQATKLFGYSRAELLGAPLELLVPERSRKRHESHRHQYATHPVTRPMGANLDLSARRKDGSEFPVEISLSPLDTPEGPLVSSAIRDITQRKVAEAERLASLEQFRALAEASPIGIVHSNANGTIDFANDRWKQITGVKNVHDMDHIRNAVHPDDHVAVAKWERCLREGREFDAEIRFIWPDGTIRWTHSRAVPLRDESGAVTGFVGAMEDTTESRVAADLRMREQQNVAELNRLQNQANFKTNFLRTAAHELGTPLTPIRIQLRILKDLLDQEPQVRAFGILERNFQRLQGLVSDLLESARVQSNKLRLSMRPIDLATIVHDVVETFQETAIQSNVTLDTMGATRLPVVADPDRVSQVLFNLVSNAMKFTPAGGHVAINLKEGLDDAILEVIDSGSGFTPEQVDLLFKPFSQIHDPMQTNAPGTGLGLYICKGIIEQHGGTIRAYSPGPGQGSTFTVRLPRSPPQNPAPQGEDLLEANGDVSAAENKPQPALGKGK